MRLLLISDIHANWEALEAVLWLAPPYEQVANLGDAVGYGASPNEVVERLRALPAIHVRGNHDVCCAGLEEPLGFNPTAARAARWTRRALSEDCQRWLRELPMGPVHGRLCKGTQFVHGSPLDEFDYLDSSYAALEVLQATRASLTFFGHTHVPAVYARARRGVEELELPVESDDGVQCKRLQLESGTRYVINPGSVGQPRDGEWRAAFALYDSQTREICFYRVPYDVALAQQKILAAGLPSRLALRLAQGL